jgi:GntR family transcriptional repressor for pyruvate dehydrogenase complex
MEFIKIKHARVYESVIEQIVTLIKHNKLKPGDKLPSERELAGKLSINRAPLREAFRVLEYRGLIESKPGGGRFVRDLRQDLFTNNEDILISLKKYSILELLEAREVLEVKIAEIAAKKALEKDIVFIEEVMNKTKYEERSVESNMQYDTEFHLSVSKATHNFVFVNIMKLHLDLLNETSRNTLNIPGRIEKQFQEHRLIFEAIRDHDVKKAGETTLEHLKNIRNAITKV